MKLGRKDICASIVLALALWVAPGVRADVTIRYQSEFKPSAAFGPIIAPFMKTVQAGSATSVRMKGNKAYTTSGNWIQIFDFVKQEVTLIDPAHKTFAAFPVSQFAVEWRAPCPRRHPSRRRPFSKPWRRSKPMSTPR